MNPQSTNRRKFILIVVGILAVLAIIFGLVLAALNHASTPQGTVHVFYSLSDTSDVTVQFNGKKTNTKDSYTLATGDYTVTVTRPGYTDFSTSFSLAASQTQLINVQLALANTPTVENPAQLTLYPGITNVQIVGTQYFFNRLWSVTTINADGYTNAVVVAQYDPSNGTWITVLGPADAFQQNDTNALPTAIQTYLADNQRIQVGE